MEAKQRTSEALLAELDVEAGLHYQTFLAVQFLPGVGSSGSPLLLPPNDVNRLSQLQDAMLNGAIPRGFVFIDLINAPEGKSEVGMRLFPEYAHDQQASDFMLACEQFIIRRSKGG